MFKKLNKSFILKLISTWKGKIMGFFRGQVAVLADKRIRLLGELIRAMRVVKMYVWEGHFVQNLIIGNFQNIISYKNLKLNINYFKIP